jgi:hypothetical protein
MRAGATAPALASCIACCIACMCGCPADCGGSNRQAGEACRSWPGGSPQFSCGARVFLVSGLADVAVATRARGGALCPLRHAGRGIRPGSIPRSGSLKSHNARLSAVTRPFVQFRAFLELSRKQCVLASVADRPVCVAPSRLGLSTLFRYTSGFVTARMSGGRAGPGGVLAVCRIDRTELGGE